MRRLFSTSFSGQLIYCALKEVYWQLKKLLPDAAFARIKYFDRTGRLISLRNPQLLSEKLWWLKLHNRDPKLTRLSDKLAVRDYVSEKGFEDILIPLVSVFDSPSDIDFGFLPERAFLKATHASGLNAAWDARIPFDFEGFKRKFSTGLRRSYFWKSREWNYKNIRPRIIVEEHLADESLIDYRFLCFNGRVRLVFVDIETANEDGTHGNARRNVYDPSFNLLPVTVRREPFDARLVSKPAKFDEMIKIAESLAEGIPFVRVDLYWTSGSIRFGEMTFYPGGGNQLASPLGYERLWGSWLDIPTRSSRRE